MLVSVTMPILNPGEILYVAVVILCRVVSRALI